jgi:hypothetical protein
MFSSNTSSSLRGMDHLADLGGHAAGASSYRPSMESASIADIIASVSGVDGLSVGTMPISNFDFFLTRLFPLVSRPKPALETSYISSAQSGRGSSFSPADHRFPSSLSLDVRLVLLEECCCHNPITLHLLLSL